MTWLLALHSLRFRPLRTFLTALGIAVAVGSMVIFLSLGEGLRQAFANEIGNVGPDLQVSYGPFDTNSLTAVPELPLSYLNELKDENNGYGVRDVTPILLYVRGSFTPGTSFLFQGTPPDKDIGQIYFDFKILEGRGLTAEDINAHVAVVGKQTVERNQLALGGTLRIRRDAEFTIVGVAESAGGLIDNAILVPLQPLQEAIGITDRVTFFALELDEPGKAAQVAKTLGDTFPDLGFQTRGDVLSVIEKGIQITDVVRFGISIIALIVGAIAVANTVLMSVFERTKEFGVVRALGAKPRFLFILVLIEAILLSLVGAALGVLLGWGGIVIVNDVAFGLIGLEVAALTLRLIIFAVIVAIIMGLSSGLLPAARAARIPIAVAMARE